MQSIIGQMKEQPKDIVARQLSSLMEAFPPLGTQQKLAKRTGIGQTTIGRIRRGEVNATADNIKRIAEAFSVPVSYLYGETDVSGLTEEEQNQLMEQRLEEYESQRADGNLVSVPRFDVRGSMGAGFPMPEHDHVIERIQVTAAWVRDALPSITSPRNLALMPAFGDSMEGTFSDGDMLWVDRGVTEVKIDAVYVLALRDELYVKRLQRRPDGSVLMISDNKAYEPYLIQNGEREKFQVLGRVVFAWRGKRL
ncbi:helix-turn-helix domain-containing protein [Ralstonia pickettii]|uniref:XRE family transcriptional regulator n=1 Tax=Ralstonia pickettii TaxID=329 RepID=UPI002714C02F|nr:LexA family transcriptional regulator [Ralstonia pickettii]WKZ84195.1 helix-turn-helix domain-containing protein [Ralstonia pickettii]